MKYGFLLTLMWCVAASFSACYMSYDEIGKERGLNTDELPANSDQSPLIYQDMCPNSSVERFTTLSVNLRKGPWQEVLTTIAPGSSLVVSAQPAVYQCKQAQQECYWWRQVVAVNNLPVDGWVAESPQWMACDPIYFSFEPIDELFELPGAALSSQDEGYVTGSIPTGWQVHRDQDEEWAGDVGTAERHIDMQDTRMVLGCKRCSFGIEKTIFIAQPRILRIPFEVIGGNDVWAEVLINGKQQGGKLTQEGQSQVVAVAVSGWTTIEFRVGREQPYGVKAAFYGLYYSKPITPNSNDLFDGIASISPEPSYATGTLPSGWMLHKDADDWANGLNPQRRLQLVNGQQIIGCNQCSFGIQKTFQLTGKATMKIPMEILEGSGWAAVLVNGQLAGKKLLNAGERQVVEVEVNGSTLVQFRVGREGADGIQAAFYGVTFDTLLPKVSSDSFSGPGLPLAKAEANYARGFLADGWRLFKDNDNWAKDYWQARRRFAIKEGWQLLSCQQGSFGMEKDFVLTKASTLQVPVYVVQGTQGWVEVLVNGQLVGSKLMNQGQWQMVSAKVPAGQTTVTLKVGQQNGTPMLAAFDQVAFH